MEKLKKKEKGSKHFICQDCRCVRKIEDKVKGLIDAITGIRTKICVHCYGKEEIF